jgi:hypothetical protein
VRCRLRLFLHLCLRALAGSTGLVIPGLADLMAGQPVCLPRGHPERLVPDVPPSEQERLLWAQLAGIRELTN